MKLRTLLLLAVLCTGWPTIVAADTVLTPADSVAMDWSRVPEYRIVPGDRLLLDFGRRPDGALDAREARVRPDGRITVFPAGDVVAAGLTPMELQRNIISLLSAGYIHLLWLAFFGTPLWGASALALVWAFVIFRYA